MNVSETNIKFFWKPLLTAAALVFLYANVLAKLGFDWWTDENYSHGLLVPLVIGFIVWAEWDELREFVKIPNLRGGLALMLPAFVMLLAGTLGAELFTQRISLVVMIAGMIVYFFGAKILKLLAVPFGLLLLAIPIPQILFNKLAFPLQIYASQMAVWGIRLFDVPTVRKGNVIEILPHGAMQVMALEVVEACSGIRSLMTLVTLALVLAYLTRDGKSQPQTAFWKKFDFWRAIVLMLLAVPIAVLTNAARVTATGILTFYDGAQATANTFHEISGWLVYVVALVLLLGANYLLKRIQDSRFKIADSESIRQSPIIIRRPAIANQTVAFLVLILISGGVLINWFERRGEAEVTRTRLAEFPEKIGDWRQKGSEIRFDPQTESVLRADDYTQRVYLAPDGRTVNAYVGYYASQKSGATYHSPQNCLPGAGWTMRDPDRIEISTPNGKTFTANRYVVENGADREILIYWYEGRGRTEASEYRDKLQTIFDSVLRRRSDGSMVRVMTTIGKDENAANQSAVKLAAEIEDQLPAFVPQ